MQIFISILSSDSKTERKCTFSLNKQTRYLNHTHSLMRMQQMLSLVGKYPPEMNHQKVKVEFSRPVRVAKTGTGPLGANDGSYTANSSSCHVHSTLWVIAPTSPCPTLSADAEPAHQRTEYLFCAMRSVM